MAMSGLKVVNAVGTVSVFLAILFVTSAPTAAQVPTFREVAGHEFGDRITLHHQMVRYVEQLAATSPRVRLVWQGYSWEGRSLPVVIVTSPENHQRLDAIQARANRLNDPRTTTADDARGIIADQPAIIWLGGSIHGFELSGSEGVLKLLEHLTTRNDPVTMEVLRQTVVLIDPMLNPDGRDAFAHLNHENIGRKPTSNRDDWSNDFNFWQALKFRTGHYYFDTNRDWFAHTQRETQGRVPTLRAWRPQVVVDFHEMGHDQEFYFDPPTDPVGPFFPAFASRWFKVFGDAYAAAFDSAGFEYTTREMFNYFYPAYTTSYGSYQGAVGMLTEQGSSRGLRLEISDGSVRTLADALEQQYVAAWTVVQVAARERERMLSEYYEAHREAVADGQRGIRRYLIPPGGDPSARLELARLLERNGIEVTVLTQSTTLSGVRDRTGPTVGSRAFPAGTFVVEAAQPRNRLLRALLEPEVPIPAEFLRQARARVERAENPRFYDITAWSLPLLFNVDAYSTSDVRALSTSAVAEAERAPLERAQYAYLLDGANASSMAALYHLRAKGYRGGVLTAPTRIGGGEMAGGAAIVRVGQNDTTVHEAVRRIAERYDIAVTATRTGLSDSGFPTLSAAGQAFNIAEPRIAILAEMPIQAYSFGWAWYTLDRQFEVPVTVFRTGSVSRLGLDRYNVIVIPETQPQALANELGEAGIERLRRWVREGGTLVTIGNATEFARTQFQLGLRNWYDTDEGKNKQQFSVPGAVFRAVLNRDHWMTAGYGEEMPVLVNSARLYLPPDGPPSSGRRVIATYADTNPRISGHAWDETLERIPGAVYAYEERVGQGRVITFAEEVNFRAYTRGANRLFLNAVVLGPSAP